MFCRQKFKVHTLVAPYHGARVQQREQLAWTKQARVRWRGIRWVLLRQTYWGDIAWHHMLHVQQEWDLTSYFFWNKFVVDCHLSEHVWGVPLRKAKQRRSIITTTQSHSCHSLSMEERFWVFVKDGRGGDLKWIEERIVSVKGTRTYLVRVNVRVRYCHVEHLQNANRNEERLQTANQSPCYNGTSQPQPTVAMPIRSAALTNFAVPNTENTMADYNVSPSPESTVYHWDRVLAPHVNRRDSLIRTG